MLWKKLRPFAEKYDDNSGTACNSLDCPAERVTAPIVGAKNPTQVLDNVKACNFVISDEDFKAIDKISQAFAYKLPHFQTFFRA